MAYIGEIITYTTRDEANNKVDKQARYRQIMECLKGKELTAKELAVAMYEKGYIPTTERNFTAPRLTELSSTGIVEPIGKKVCEYTGKKVAVYRIVPRERQLRLDI